MWQSNIDNEAPPEYECFQFFNLTNGMEIANNPSATPTYEEKGPYCYRLNHEKVNVSWTDDGNIVSFNMYM
jgi:hypothetical protein